MLNLTLGKWSMDPVSGSPTFNERKKWKFTVEELVCQNPHPFSLNFAP